MIELDQIMRQQGDNSFTKVLNRIRVGSLDDEEFKILSARVVTKTDIGYPRKTILVLQCTSGLIIPLLVITIIICWG